MTKESEIGDLSKKKKKRLFAQRQSARGPRRPPSCACARSGRGGSHAASGAGQRDPLETAAKNEQLLCKQISQNSEPEMMTNWQIEGLQRLLKRKKETNHGGKAAFNAHTCSPSTWTPR